MIRRPVSLLLLLAAALLSQTPAQTSSQPPSQTSAQTPAQTPAQSAPAQTPVGAAPRPTPDWTPDIERRQHDPQRRAELARAFERAKEGDLDAMREAAEALLMGHGAAPNPASAAELLQQAADAGDAKATQRLGDLYQQGVGVKRDLKRALELYEQAVEAGDSTAIAGVGWMHFQGLGVKADPVEAVRWYRRAAEAGSPEGMNNLGFAYLTGQGVARDPQAAREWLQRAAEGGNAWAMDSLGDMYLSDATGARDVPQAVSWYRRATAEEHSASAVKLAHLYLGLAGDPPDYAKSMHWALAAANLGNAAGMRAVAYLHLNGLGVPRSARQALVWFDRSARHGQWDSAIDVAALLIHGAPDVPAAPQQGIRVLENSARLGNPLAMGWLAELYLEGRVVERNLPQAEQWLEQAAALGHSASQLSLAALLLAKAPADPEGRQRILRWIDAAQEALPERAAALRKEFEAAADGQAPLEIQRSGVRFTPRPAWREIPRGLAVARFLLGDAADGDAEAELTLMRLPWNETMLAANANRWRRELQLPVLPAADAEQLYKPGHVDGRPAHFLYLAADGDTPRQTLAVVVPLGEDGLFLRLHGAAAVVRGEKGALIELLQTMKLDP